MNKVIFPADTFRQPTRVSRGHGALSASTALAALLVAGVVAVVPVQPAGAADFVYSGETPGTWDTTTTLWNPDAFGGTAAWVDTGPVGNTATFSVLPSPGGNPLTIVTDGASDSRNVSGMTFNVSGYTVAADNPGVNSLVLANGGGNVTITVANPGGTAEISAPIASLSTEGLVKAGAGTLTLSGANTFSGPLDVAAGTVVLAGGAAVADATAVNVGAAGTLSVDQHEIVGTLSGVAGGVVNVADGIVFTTNASGDSTFAGDLVGGTASQFIKGAGSVLTFSGDGSGFQGLFGVNGGGELVVAAGTTLGAADVGTIAGATFTTNGGALASDARVISDGTVNFNGSEEVALLTDNAGSGPGTGTININGAATVLTLNGTRGGPSGHSGTIAGTGGLTVTGGTHTLSGTNTYSGTTAVNGGTLALDNGAALSDTGAVTVNAGTLQLLASETVGSLGGTGGTVALGANTLTAGGTNASTSFAGAISGTGGSLVKQGAGTLALSGASTYTGGTTINGGTLTVGNAAALGAGSVELGNAHLRATVNFSTPGLVFEFSGTTATVSAAAGTTLTLGPTVMVAPSGATYRFGATGDTGTVVLGGIGSVGGETWENAFFVDAGTLRLGGNDYTPLVNSTSLTIAAGATFDMNGTGVGPDPFSSAGTRVLSGAGTITNNAADTGTIFEVSGTGADSTFAGSIVDGAGGTGQVYLWKSQASTLTLSGSGNNTYSGETVVMGGTLRGGAANAFSAESPHFVQGGAFLDLGGFDQAVGALNGDGTVTNSGGTPATLTAGAAGYDGAFSGTIEDGTGGLALTKAGTGILTLSGTNTYTGATTIDGGTLALDNGAALSDTGAVTVNAGTLQLQASETIGSFAGTAGTVALGANTLTAGGTNASTSFAGAISGTGGSLVKQGAGTLTLSGANTYTGATAVNAGTLQIGNGGATGTLGNNSNAAVAAGATLAFNRSNAYTYSGVISGAGDVEQNGSGTTILSGNSSAFAGTTTVNAGTLRVDGTLGVGATSTLTVASTGTLGGTGTIGGDVTVNGRLSAGASPGTLVVAGDLTLNAASNSDFELGQAGTVGGTNNDLVTVGGNLTLAGTLNLSNPLGGAVQSGYYTLFSVAGTTTGAFATITTAAGPAVSDVDIYVTNGGLAGNNVNAFIQNGGQIVQFWDGADHVGNGAVDGGADTWNAANTNWTTADGAVNDLWRSGVGIFGGTGGNVAVSGTQDFEGLQFIADGYVLAGGTLNMTGDSVLDPTHSFINVDNGVTAQIGSVLSADAGVGLAKGGAGTLVLSGANTYDGGTTVSAGTLQAGSNSAFGAATNALAVSGSGTVDLGGFALTQDTVTLSDTGTIEGAGTLTATTSVTQSGGTMAANVATALYTLSNGNVAAGAAVNATTFNQSGGGMSGAVTGTTYTLSNGTLGGSGSANVTTFNQSSGVMGGAVTATTYGLTGGVVNTAGTINATTVNQSNGLMGGTATVTNYALSGGTMSGTTTAATAFTQSNGIMSGTVNGALYTLSGGTVDAAGTANVTTMNQSDGLMAGTATVTDYTLSGGTMSGTATAATEFAQSGGTMSGTVNGALYTLSAGTVDAAGTANVTTFNQSGGSMAGAANVGTYQLTGGTLSGSAVATTLFDMQAGLVSGDLSGAAALVKSGAGAVTLSGTNTFGGGTTVNAGTLALAGGAALSDTGTVTVNAGTLQLQASETIGSLAGAGGTVALGANTLTTGGNNASTAYAGVVAGSGNLVKNGTGTLTLSGASTYGGQTTVNAGVLDVTGSLASAQVEVNGPGSLHVDGASLSDTAAVTLAGNGNLTLTGFETIGSLEGAAASTVTLGANTLTTGGNNASTAFAGVMSGTGGLTKQGTGTFTLSGANTYGGTTAVNAGTLLLDGASLAGPVTVASAGTLGVGANSSTGALALGNGRLDMRNGVATNRLTVNGNMSSAGGTLYLDADLSGSVGASDNILVNGNSSGTANVQFASLGAAAGLQDDPTLVMRATGNNDIDLSALSGSFPTSSIIAYALRQEANGDWVIQSSVNVAGVAGLASSINAAQAVIGNIINRPSSAFVTGLAQAEPDTCGFSPWMRGTGGGAKSSTDSMSRGISETADVAMRYGGMQASFDFGCNNIGDDNLNINAGLTTGINLGTTHQDQFSAFSGARVLTDTQFENRFVGAYVTFSKGAFSADLQGRIDETDFDITSSLLATIAGGTGTVNNVGSRRVSLSGSASYDFPLKDGWKVTPTAGFNFSNTKTDDIVRGDLSLEFGSMTNLVGFAGVTLSKFIILPDEVSALQPFVTATIYNDFAPDAHSRFTYPNPSGGTVSQIVDTENLGTYGEISVGTGYLKVLDNGFFGPAKQLSASIRGDLRFGERVFAGGVTAQMRLQF